MSKESIEKQVKSWLEVALVKEELDDIFIDITGSTEEGSGYVGHMIFVTVTAKQKNSALKKYDLLLKCSTSNKALIEQNPVLFEACVNESYVYEKIFPAFMQFEIERGVDNPFDSIAKCYGVFNSVSRNVIILQNLNRIDYHLWDQKMPLLSQHINLVLENYAKVHAVSVAMMEQEPQKFQILADGLKDVPTNFFKNCGFVDGAKKVVEDMYNLLKNDINKNILRKWIHLKDQIDSVLFDIVPNIDSLKVIVHGDCWGNNYMFKYNNKEKSSVSNVAMLDWQGSKYSSPVLDLSYFLFSCSPNEVFENMDIILKKYYDSLISHLQKLESNFSPKYSLETFLNDWRKYGKYGIIMCLMPLKLSFLVKAKIPDMGASAEKGGDVAEAFHSEVGDEKGYKNRIIPIVKYAVKSGLI